MCYPEKIKKKLASAAEKQSARYYYGMDSLLTALYRQEAFSLCFTDSHHIQMEQRQQTKDDL